MSSQQIPTRQLARGDAAEGQGIVLESGLWVPGDVVRGLTSDDSSVTITDNGDGTYDLAAAGGGGGGVETIVAGTGISVDDTDPANPIVSATGGGGGGSITQSYLGYNTVGGSTVALATGVVYLKKITVATDGIMTSVDAYIANTADSVGTIGAQVLEDVSGSPGSMLSYVMNNATSFVPRPAPGTNGPGRWFAIPVSMWLPAGDYWVGVMGVRGGITLAYDGSGSDRTYNSGAAWFADAGRYTITTTSNKYSIRVPVVS